MKKYKSILINIGWFLGSIIVYLILVTSLAHFNLLSYKVVSTLSFIFMCLLFLLSGFKLGKKSEKRGYLTGLFIGGINVIILLIFGLLLRSIPSIKSLFYFLILILSSILGGMFGINFKKNT